MTNSFKGIIKLSQSQYEKIINGENLIVNNKEYKYDANIVYIVEDIKVTLDTEQTITGKKDFTGGLTLNGKELIIKDEAVTVTEVQDITGNKNFAGLLSYKGKEIAIKEEIPTVSDSLDAEYKDNAMAVNQGIILNEKITALIENVNGRVQSFSVTNLEELGNLFGIDISEAKDEYIVPTNSITYKNKEYNLKTGDIFLIVDVAVPDYWFSLEDMKLFKMETSKVDLSGFVTDEEFEALSEEVNKKADQISLDETNQNVSSNATKIEELESSKLERTDLPNINGNNEYNSANNFYAPTAKGNYGQLLMSNGTNAPSWTNMPDIQGSVTLSHILPSEYQEIEYVECDGGQLIDTQVISNGEDFKMEGNTYAPLDAGRSYNYFFASADTIDGPRGNYFYPGSNRNDYGIVISYPVSMFDKYLTLYSEDIFDKFISWSLILHKEHKTGRKDRLEILTEQGKEYFAEYTSTNSIANAKIILFSNDGSGLNETNSFVGKAGKFKIYIDGVIQRDLIPCYRKDDNVIGYYDLLNGVFYENIGSRPFVKGPDMPVDTIKQYQFMAQNIYQGTKRLADTYVPLERTISGKTLGKDIQLELSDIQTFEWSQKSNLLSNLLEKEYYKSKNILPVYGIGKTINFYDVDFTRNEDGTVTINGKGSISTSFYLSDFDDVAKQSRLPLDPNKTYRISIQKISGKITGGYVSEENYLNDIAASGIGVHFDGSYMSSSTTSIGGYFNFTGKSELTDIRISFSQYYTYENFVIGFRLEEVESVEDKFLLGKGPIVHQQEMDEAIANIDTTETDPTVPSYVKSISETDISNWNNKLDGFTETDPTVPSYVKAITEEDIASWDSKVDANTQSLAYYTLSTGVGSKLELSIDTSTYVMTLKLTNSSGTVLDTKTVDLPLETMVVNASYDSTNKKIVLTLKNGETTSFSVADLVSGLASTSDLANYLPLTAGSGKSIKGDLYTSHQIMLNNSRAIQGKKSDGNYTTLININLDDDVIINGGESGETTIGGSAITPKYTDKTDLGTSSHKYKNIYASGTANLHSAKISSYLTMNNEARISAYDTNGNAKDIIYYANSNNIGIGNDTAKLVSFSPIQPASYDDNLLDLGTATARWKDLYIYGNLHDGTNFTRVADIKKKYTWESTLSGAAGWYRICSLSNGITELKMTHFYVGSDSAIEFGQAHLKFRMINCSGYNVNDDNLMLLSANYTNSANKITQARLVVKGNSSQFFEVYKNAATTMTFSVETDHPVNAKYTTTTSGDTVPNGYSAKCTKYISYTGKMIGTISNADSATNAAKLNNQEPSYYLNYNNLSNKPAIPTQYLKSYITEPNVAITGVNFLGSRIYVYGHDDIQAFSFYNWNSLGNATQYLAGLMSAADKTKLDKFPLSIYPVGAIYLSITNTSPASFLGGSWAQIGAGYALWTATSGAGNTISAGLPNITGEFNYATNANESSSASSHAWGAFTIHGLTDGQAVFGDDGDGSYWSFNANNGASTKGIYGNSTTVQPPAYKVYAWRRTA